MLFGYLGNAVIQDPIVGTDRHKGRVLEFSVAHSYRVLGTSEIRYGLSGGIEWSRPSRALQIKSAGIVAQQSAYLRLFRSFKANEGFTGIVLGVGGRWMGESGSFKNGYFEAGTGLSLVDGISNDVNSYFNFVSFVGAGVYFSDNPSAGRIGLRWSHISNAQIDPPNRGLNQFELVFGVRL